MPTTTLSKLIDFLQQEIGISDSSIKLAQAEAEAPNLLPIILWQDGFLSLEQLEQIFDWLETENYLLNHHL